MEKRGYSGPGQPSGGCEDNQYGISKAMDRREASIGQLRSLMWVKGHIGIEENSLREAGAHQTRRKQKGRLPSEAGSTSNLWAT